MDLDRYYTPPPVATELVSAGLCGVPTACVVADTACGCGNLLSAAVRVLPAATCIGTDKDRNAIRRLRARNPEWLLSVADVLDDRVFSRARAVVDAPACNLLTLNPPFSMSANKSVTASFYGNDMRTSVAMAHILKSMETLRPTGGAVAIVPESLLFSQLDLAARLALAECYETRILRGLGNSTFRGARANAVLVRWLPRARSWATPSDSASQTPHQPHVVRGGLPLFEASIAQRGIPLVHSTSLAELARTGSTEHCLKVRPISRGVVNGVLLLLPRVGVPLVKYFRVVRLGSAVQLSDCMFALCFSSVQKANVFRKHALAAWPSLVENYRGTGARYISVAKMHDWVNRIRSGIAW